MSDIPYRFTIGIKELGHDASITLLNPWLLPEPPSVPRELMKRDGVEVTAQQEDTRIAALEDWFEARMREQLVMLVEDWHGIVDLTTGKDLALPKDDPTSYDKCPRIVKRWVQRAIQACEVDMEWDPTKPLPAALTPTETPEAAKQTTPSIPSSEPLQS